MQTLKLKNIRKFIFTAEKIRHLFPRLALTAIGLHFLSSCSHIGVFAEQNWEGLYEAGPAKLELLASGKYKYDGGSSCFVGDSDAGRQDESEGHYRIEGNWITIESGGGSCSLDKKLYMLEHKGRHLLIGETYLQFIVNQKRSGQVVEKIYPYHLAGEPAEFSEDSARWMPQVYVDLLKRKPPSGAVINIGKVQTINRYSSGRFDGQENRAWITTNIVLQDGAFEGMVVCEPKGQERMKLEAVSTRQSSLIWSWSPAYKSGPTVGMPLSGYCP
jgi:hypothetical protein